jgi:hypothetical protein
MGNLLKISHLFFVLSLLLSLLLGDKILGMFSEPSEGGAAPELMSADVREWVDRKELSFTL